MTTLIFLATGLSAAVLLYTLIAFVRTWLKFSIAKKRGIETKAGILQIDVMNEPGRRVPFVKMQIAFTQTDNTCLISSVAFFIAPEEMTMLAALQQVTVRYNPRDVSQIHVVRNWKRAKQTIGWQAVLPGGYTAMAQ